MKDQYDVGLIIHGATLEAPPLTIESLPVLSAELHNQQGFHALIGMDVIGTCLFILDGQTKLFSLAF